MAWSAGTLFLGGGGALVNSGTVTATGNDSFTIASGGGTFTNNGLFQKTGGTGTTNLNGSFALDNNGTMDVRTGTIALPTNFANDGTLAGTGTYSLSGTLTNSGTIAPGNGGTGIGTLNLTGNYAQTAAGTLAIQLSSIGLADLFNISGTAALNGSLALTCQGCMLTAGDLFTILDSVGDLTGSFAGVSTSGFDGGFDYSLIYDRAADRVQLRVNNAGTAAVPEPATWLTMIGGMALVGGAMRRRRRVRLAAA